MEGFDLNSVTLLKDMIDSSFKLQDEKDLLSNDSIKPALSRTVVQTEPKAITAPNNSIWSEEELKQSENIIDSDDKRISPRYYC